MLKIFGLVDVTVRSRKRVDATRDLGLGSNYQNVELIVDWKFPGNPNQFYIPLPPNGNAP
jgi:hypothetical protein